MLHKFVCLQLLKKGFKARSILIFEWEINLFLKNLCYFRGSRFLQGFVLSTTLHCLLPSHFVFFSIYQKFSVPLMQVSNCQHHVIIAYCTKTTHWLKWCHFVKHEKGKATLIMLLYSFSEKCKVRDSINTMRYNHFRNTGLEGLSILYLYID